MIDDLTGACLTAPVSPPPPSSNKIQNGSTVAYPGCPGKWPLNERRCCRRLAPDVFCDAEMRQILCQISKSGPPQDAPSANTWLRLPFPTSLPFPRWHFSQCKQGV